MNSFVRTAFFATLAAIALVSGAQAQTPPEHRLGQHPAVLLQRAAVGIDPNRFVVAHPAGLTIVAAPSETYDHPAVIIARRASAAGEHAVAAANDLPVAAAWLRRPSTAVAAAGQTGGL